MTLKVNAEYEKFKIYAKKSFPRINPTIASMSIVNKFSLVGGSNFIALTNINLFAKNAEPEQYINK